MSFQIKDFVSITLSQINHARSVTTKITDFQPGSVARTLMEASAVEIEELYLQMFLGLRDAIPVATFQSFGFTKLPAARASGFVSVSRPAPVVSPLAIPIGTLFTAVDGRIYESTAAVTWAASQTVVRVPVSYGTAGLAGNIAAGLITASSAFGDGYTVSNPAITTGRDPETDAEREARFAEFVGALSRGTVYACLYAAREPVVLDENGNVFEYVTRAGLDEQPGLVRIYLYTNRGEPSSEMLVAAQAMLDGSRNDQLGTITPGYRSAGVEVQVLPMLERAVPLAVQVGMFPGYTLNSTVEQRLGDIMTAELAAVPPGATLYLGSLVESMLAVPGVASIVPTTTSNIVCGPSEALVAGVLTVAAL
jgi:Baseplate J-like protein